MNLPRFMWTRNGTTPVTYAEFFVSSKRAFGSLTIDVDKCSWTQRALIGIRLGGPFNILPRKDIERFWDTINICLYPLIHKTVENRKQLLDYLEQFNVHADVINTLNTNEKIRYIEDQFNIDLTYSSRVSVAEYFDGCFHEEDFWRRP